MLELFPAGTSNAEFQAAAERVRFQLGQSDRFRAGLVRSGTWKQYIYDVLDKRGLPRELASLPHVESSFDPTAYSKVGAAGMWQFTRSTGARYMRIDHVVDERRDPFFATDAAARLLADNYSVMQSWPLALTAYNHGLAGMRRAVVQQGPPTSRRSSRSIRAARSGSRRAISTPRSSPRSRSTRTPSGTFPASTCGRRRIPRSRRARVHDVAQVRRRVEPARRHAARLEPRAHGHRLGRQQVRAEGFALRVPRETAAVAEELLGTLDEGERTRRRCSTNSTGSAAATRCPRSRRSTT